MKMARLGVLLDRQTLERRWSFQLNAFEVYVQELLSHRGIPYETIGSLDELDLHSFDMLLVAVAPETRDAAARLWRYAEEGGRILACGGLNALAPRLGFVRGEALGAGYAMLPEASGADRPLRFLQANPWVRLQGVPAGAAEAVPVAEEFGDLASGRPDGPRVGAALQRFAIGQGYIDRWAVDIPGTIVGLQQGLGPVLEDGVPAPDGTGAVDDGVLKADDRCELDWTHDRLQTETGALYFAHPYADLWREVFTGHLVRSAAELGLSLPFVGYWPAGVSHVALVSHDSDGNKDEHAESTLSTLAACGMHSTWCMLESGYSSEIYERIQADGHELAFHYNAVEVDDGIWDGEEFTRQLTWLRDATGLERIASNKNHLTRYEGWGELFRWCEANQIDSDQTRGPSKKGNVGFIFGTCHPYFPVAWADEQNRKYNVLEVGFLTQDLDIGKWSDSSVIVPFLDQVRSVEGVAHFLFHQIHIHNREEVRRSMQLLADEARNRDFVFWTCERINDWERARRTLAIQGLTNNSTAAVQVGSRPSQSVEGETAIVWIPQPEMSVLQEGMVMKYGVICAPNQVNLTAEGLNS